MNRRKSREDSTEMISRDTPANVTERTPAAQEQLPVGAGSMRVASLGLLSIYLAASGTLLAAHGSSWLAALHATVIGVCMWAALSPSRMARPVGDLLPLVVAPALYGEIPRLIAAAGTTYHDVWVQQLEAWVFGGQPSHVLAASFPAVALSEVLHLGYLTYYPMIFALPLLLYARGERVAAAECILAVVATFTVCWVIFVTMPVEGPRYLWAEPTGIPAGPIRSTVLRILVAGSSRGAAFPSSHMAIAAALTVMAFRWRGKKGWLSAVIALSIGVGAVYGGFHYAIDMVAGAVLGVAVAGAVAVYSRKTQRADPSLRPG